MLCFNGDVDLAQNMLLFDKGCSTPLKLCIFCLEQSIKDGDTTIDSCKIVKVIKTYTFKYYKLNNCPIPDHKMFLFMVVGTKGFLKSI